MKRLLERDYVKEIRSWLHSNGCWTHKTNERFHFGLPDLIVVRKGVTSFIEAKTGTTLSKTQVSTIKAIARAGGRVFVMVKKGREQPEQIVRIAFDGQPVPVESRDLILKGD